MLKLTVDSYKLQTLLPAPSYYIALIAGKDGRIDMVILPWLINPLDALPYVTRYV